MWSYWLVLGVIFKNRYIGYSFVTSIRCQESGSLLSLQWTWVAKKAKVIHTGSYQNWRDCARPLEILALLFVDRGKRKKSLINIKIETERCAVCICSFPLRWVVPINSWLGFAIWRWCPRTVIFVQMTVPAWSAGHHCVGPAQWF